MAKARDELGINFAQAHLRQRPGGLMSDAPNQSDDAPKAVAGWYPGPDGAQRYWDGEQWLNIPAPEASPTPVAVEDSSRKKRSKRGKVITAAVITVVLVLGGTGAVIWKVTNDQQVAVAEQEAADEAAEQKAEELDLAAAEKSERDDRTAAIPGIEESIRVMAEGHIVDGLIDGPVLSVDCSPVNGGSTDDLTEQTTVFSCFVANIDNGDGTMTGYKYNATMNWTTGSYTYGFGEP